MERTIPARALVVSGATLVALTGVGMSASSGSTSGSNGVASGSDHASVTRVTVQARSTSARVHSRRTTGRWSGSINVTRRASVDTAYRRAFASGLDVAT